jgi:hypothetical protein
MNLLMPRDNWTGAEREDLLVTLDKRRLRKASEGAGALKEGHCPKPGMDGATHVRQE